MTLLHTIAKICNSTICNHKLRKFTLIGKVNKNRINTRENRKLKKGLTVK